MKKFIKCLLHLIFAIGFLTATRAAESNPTHKPILRIEQAMRAWQERWAIISGNDQPVGLKNPNGGRQGVTPAGVFNHPIAWPANRNGEVPKNYPNDCFYADDLVQPNLAASRVLSLKTAIVNRLTATVAPTPGAYDPVGGVLLRFEPNWDNLEKIGADGPIRASTASRMVKVFYNNAWIYPDVNAAPFNTMLDGTITIDNYESRFRDLVTFLQLPMALNTYGTQVSATAPLKHNWVHRFIWNDIYRNSCCAACGSCTGGDCHVTLDSGGSSFSVGLGAGLMGSVGSISFYSELPTSDIMSPLSLDINLRANVVSDVVGTNIIESEAYIITSTLNGVEQPKQIYTPQGLVDIVLDPGSPSTGYTLYFYDKDHRGAYTNGLFSTNSASAFRSIHFEALGGDYNHLRITEAISGSRVSEYTYLPSTKTWSLASGVGQDQRVETLSRNWTTGTGTSVGNILTESSETKNASGQVVSSVQRKYQIFPWNTDAAGAVLSSRGRRYELVEETVDPNGLALKTTYGYDTTVDGTYVLNQSRPRLRQIEQPDGTWRRFEYDAAGHVSAEYSSFNNSSVPAAATASLSGDYRLVGSVYNGSSVCRTETIHLGSVDYVVSRNWHTTSYQGAYEVVVDEQATDPNSTHGDPKNLTSTTQMLFYGPFAGRPDRIVDPVGTVSIFAYYADTATGKVTTITLSGVPSDPANPLLSPSIVDGTRSEVIANAQGQEISRKVFDIASGLCIEQAIAAAVDSMGRVTTRVYLNGTSEAFSYNCCGVEAQTDVSGLRTIYQYDTEKRVVRETTYLGSSPNVYKDFGYTYDAVGRQLTTTEYSHGDSLDPNVPSAILRTARVYDTSGQLTTVTTPQGTTRFAYSVAGGKRQVTTTYPDNSIRIERSNRSGQLEEVGGDAADPCKYSYGVDSKGVYTLEIKPNLNYDLSPAVWVESEWTRSYSDFAGRAGDTVFPDGTKVEREYYSATDTFRGRRGKLKRETLPSDSDIPGQPGVSTLYDYDAKGNLQVTATDLDHDGIINFYSNDRIQRVVRAYSRAPEGSVMTVSTESWSTESLLNWSTLSFQVQSLESPNPYQQIQSPSGAQKTMTTTYLGGGKSTKNTYDTNGTTITEVFYGERRASFKQSSTAVENISTPEDYSYDGFGRLEKITPGWGFSTVYTYLDDNSLLSVASLLPGGSMQPPTTFTYSKRGLRESVTMPDGSVTQYRYTTQGRLWRTWGSRTYSQQLEYDPQGRLRTLSTWTAFTGEASFDSSTGKAMTSWKYDPLRGWLLAKLYADNKGPSYTYYPSGKLRKRTWARGVSTTYNYNTAGELLGIVYSDGTQSISGMEYDRLGRLTAVSDSAGDWTLAYSRGLSTVTSEKVRTGSGLMSGLDASRIYDSSERLIYFGCAGTNIEFQLGYYSGQLSYASAAGMHLYNFGHAINSGDVVEISAGIVKTAFQFDGKRRFSKATTTGGGAESSVSYTYNLTDQRTKATNADGTYWEYSYDPLGQIKEAVKRQSLGQDQLGFNYSYQFDSIGNRATTFVNAQRSDYFLSSNSLNQYASRSVPGAIDVVGTADADSLVSVNLESSQRQGTAFWRQLLTNNQAGAVWQDISVLASRPTGNAVVKKSGHVFVPPATETYNYDLDGNLTSDGRWNYNWDAENRLIAMETSSAAVSVGVPWQRLEFSYDRAGRRIRKCVKNWSASISNFETASDIRFIYDGWNLVAELDALANNAVKRRYLWGPDRSGSLQGAGGIGGLLAMTVDGVEYVPAMDANGNVKALFNANDGSIAAQFEYSPFGEVIQATGPSANVCPFGFGTKYTDTESGLVYYGFRYYNPTTGRWPSRDPIEEEGDLNLYGICKNHPTGAIDLLGLFEDPMRADTALKTVGLVEEADAEALAARQLIKEVAKDAALEVARKKALEEAARATLLAAAAYAETQRSAQATKTECNECKFKWLGYDTGGDPNHERYIAKLSAELRGPFGNIEVTTPEGIIQRFDGGGPSPIPKIVFEAKTQHRWAANPDAPQAWINTRAAQFGAELAVAIRCKLQYRIYFQEPPAYRGFKDRLPAFAPFMVFHP